MFSLGDGKQLSTAAGSAACVGSVFHARGVAGDRESRVADSSTCPRHDEVARQERPQDFYDTIRDTISTCARKPT